MDLHCVYLAPLQFIWELEYELRQQNIPILWQKDRLVGVGKKHTQPPNIEPGTQRVSAPDGRGKGHMLYGWHGDVFHPVWAQNIWYSPQLIPVTSIGDAAKKLRALQRNWSLYSIHDHRRATLIQEKLPPIKEKLFSFGHEPYFAPLGAWTLWDQKTLLASSYCSNPFLHGDIPFAENKSIPPNRAYLKLWEAFTLLGIIPRQNTLCLDFGSSPGGWSWVLANLGAFVFSVDKAPLAAHIEQDPRVFHCQGSAFGLPPEVVGKADWLFSDVACYPERLLQLVKNYLDHTPRINMLCTLKLTGTTNFEAIDAFLSIPNSFAHHLAVNKHEITWCYLNKPEAYRPLPL